MHFEQSLTDLAGDVTENSADLEAERSHLSPRKTGAPLRAGGSTEWVADQPARGQDFGQARHNHQDQIRQIRYARAGICNSDWGRTMVTAPELATETLASFLSHMDHKLGLPQNGLAELISSVAGVALDYIGNSDALYHNLEHTMLVTFVGYDIMRGRALITPTLPSDYAHFMAACLFHDIGYVRGILKGDGADGYVINENGGKTKLPRGSSDAALSHYHVDRSKLFVMDRIAAIDGLDAGRICRAIEFTRFPIRAGEPDDHINEEGCLMRAADLIGQLGDPHYFRKANALYHEFEEVGLNKQLGYACPADLVELFPQFYWKCISPHIQTAIQYLNVTSSGRQWIANLYSNIFRAEKGIHLSGPEH